MPSVSDKQRRFMGAELGRKRAGQKTQTGMSEKQLGEFASSVKGKGSLEDIDFHENAAETDVLCDEFIHPQHKVNGEGDSAGLESKGAVIWGALDPPDLDGRSEQFSKGKQSCNRDAGQGIHYGAPVDYFGPDTDYRAEEINPQDYGRDWDPFPLRDMFKDQKKDTRRNVRLEEEASYYELQTSGAVTDLQPQAEAYGAVNHKGAGPDREVPDYRSFSSQIKFRRNVEEPDADMPKLSGRDTKAGKDIR